MPELTKLRAALVVSSLLLSGGPVSLPAQEPAAAPDAEFPSPVRQRIAELIRQLGDNRYVAREAATAELIKLGIVARRDLNEALQNPDAEVRYRASRILAVVIESDFEKRLEAFVEDDDGSEQIGLPGWEKSRPVLGSDRGTREFFVQMQRTESELLQAYEEDPKQASHLLHMRLAIVQDMLRQTFQGRRVEPPVGTLATMLLVGADPEVPVNDPIAVQITQLCHRPPFPVAINDPRYRGHLLSLMGAWIARLADSPGACYHAIVLGVTYDVPEALQPALRLVADAGTQPAQRMYAVLTVGRFGSREHLAVLEPLLTDETVTSRGRVNSEIIPVQLRDVALATLVQLTKQDLKQYGFERFEEHHQYGLTPGSLTFKDDAARQAALEKWKAWRAAGE